MVFTRQDPSLLPVLSVRLPAVLAVQRPTLAIQEISTAGWVCRSGACHSLHCSFALTDSLVFFFCSFGWSPSRYVRLMPPPLDVVLDARRVGNEGRFARSGCWPNAVVRPVICVPSASPSSANNTNANTDTNSSINGNGNDMDRGPASFSPVDSRRGSPVVDRKGKGGVQY